MVSKKRVILVLLVILIPIVIAAKIDDDSKELFDQGEYIQTYYDDLSSYMQLNESYDYGNYTSRVLDANMTAEWQTLSWTQDEAPLLVLIDIE